MSPDQRLSLNGLAMLTDFPTTPFEMTLARLIAKVDAQGFVDEGVDGLYRNEIRNGNDSNAGGLRDAG
jgi:hypothetical protein